MTRITTELPTLPWPSVSSATPFGTTSGAPRTRRKMMATRRSVRRSSWDAGVWRGGPDAHPLKVSDAQPAAQQLYNSNGEKPGKKTVFFQMHQQDLKILKCFLRHWRKAITCYKPPPRCTVQKPWYFPVPWREGEQPTISRETADRFGHIPCSTTHALNRGVTFRNL